MRMGPGGSGWGVTVTAILVALKTLGGRKPLKIGGAFKNQSHHIYTFFQVQVFIWVYPLAILREIVPFLGWGVKR